jgi:hypothetical protein
MAQSTHPHAAPRERSSARAVQSLGAALVVATGVVHHYLYHDYFSAVPTIGRLFLANFVAGVILGALLLLRRGWIWPLLGAGYCAGTLAAFLWSVQWGLFGYHETLRGSWQDRAAVIEIAGVLVCLAATLLTSRGHGQPSRL